MRLRNWDRYPHQHSAASYRLQANLQANLKTNLHTLGNWVRVAGRSRVALTLASESRARKASYWCCGCGDSSPGGGIR